MVTLSKKGFCQSKLNTKGCCFLCLASNYNVAENAEVTLNSVTLQSLIRYLQIIPKSVPGLPQDFLSDGGNKEIDVDLCESCKMMNSRLSVLFQELLKVQLEIDYFPTRIHSCITTSAKDPQLVQNYSKRMTSDVEALVQLAFADNLRKEVAQRSLAKRISQIPYVNLKRITAPPSHESIQEDNFVRVNHIEIEDDIDESVHVGCGTPSDHPLEFESPSSPTESADVHDNEGDPVSSPDVSETALKKEEKEIGCVLSKKRKPLMKNKKPPVKKNENKGNANISKVFERDPVTGWFCCRKCDKRSRGSGSIYVHYKTIHLKRKWKCDICKVTVFTQASHLSFHKKTCQQKLDKKLERENDPNFKFVCNDCGKRFDLEQKLNIHRQTVHEAGYQHQCEFCQRKFKDRFTLNKHRNAVHLGKTFDCRFCKKKYRRQYNLKDHVGKCMRKFNV